MDSFAEMSLPGVKVDMMDTCKKGGALRAPFCFGRSARPCFQVYLMASFTAGCEMSAKLSMRDTSVHTSSPRTHRLDNTGSEKCGRSLLLWPCVWLSCPVVLCDNTKKKGVFGF